MDKDIALPGMGIVRASTDLMRHWLFLPEGFEVVNAHMEPGGQIIAFTVKHQEASIDPDGAELPIVTPIFQTKRDEDGVEWHRIQKITIAEKSDLNA